MIPQSPAARAALNAMQSAAGDDGYVRLDELLLRWSRLPYGDSAIARALHVTDVWPLMRELVREREMATNNPKTFVPRQSQWVGWVNVFDDARQAASAEGAQEIRESHVGVALVSGYATQVAALQLQPERFIAFLRESEQPSARATDTQTAVTVTREGIFVGGQTYDAMNRVLDLVSAASRSIVIVDNYLSKDVLDLLTGRAPGVEVRLLTTEATPLFRPLAIAYAKQYGGLSVRTTEAFHDRFVVIDNHDFYHFGASLKDAGKKAFMFSRIEEPAVVETVTRLIEEQWASGTVLV